MYRIYLITNIANGKTYVGKTKFDEQKRWQQHVTLARYASSRPLIKAIQKYGKQTFNVSSLDSTENQRLANWLESFYIGLTRSHVSKGGYNLTAGGEGLHHFSHSIETRIKIGKAHIGNKYCLGKQNTLGYKHTPEAKEKIAEASRGRILSEEGRKKISLSKLGNKYCAGKKNSLGYHHTDETKERISKARKGIIFSEETKERISAAKKGHKVSLETREKIRRTLESSTILPEYKEAAKKGASIACHKRWHLARGIVNLNCRLCQGETNEQPTDRTAAA